MLAMKFELIIKIIDWVIYICLCASAIYCIITSNVIQDYLNEYSDTYQTEVEANDTFPEVKFCHWSSSQSIFLLRNQYVYEYKGANRITNISSHFNVLGKCLVFQPPPGLNQKKTKFHHIRLKLNTSITNLPNIAVYVASKDNPVMRGIHHDGGAIRSYLRPKTSASFYINEKRAKYLPQNCRAKTIFDYWVTNFQKAETKCPVKCRPEEWNSFLHLLEPLTLFPTCEDEKSSTCWKEWRRKMLNDAKQYCSSISYEGDVVNGVIANSKNWCSKVSKK